MNYLCYPDELGIYEKIKYKFSIRSLNNSYMEILMRLDMNESIINLRSIKGAVSTIGRYYGFENNLDSLILNLNNWESSNLIKKIKEKTQQLYFSEKAEKVRLKRIITLLKILKIELEKTSIANKKNSLIMTLKKWENKKNIDKFKTLQSLENDYCYHYLDKKYDDFIKIRRVLEKIIKKEECQDYILNLERLINSLKIYELPSQIREMASKIKIEQDLEVKEEKKGKLVDFINKKTEDKRYQYIYNESDWTLWIEEVKEIGIEVNLEKKKVFLKEENKENIYEIINIDSESNLV